MNNSRELKMLYGLAKGICFSLLRSKNGIHYFFPKKVGFQTPSFDVL